MALAEISRNPDRDRLFERQEEKRGEAKEQRVNEWTRTDGGRGAQPRLSSGIPSTT